MKIFFIGFILSIYLPALHAQTGTNIENTHTPNSYKEIYSRTRPTLNYMYDEGTQTHNYSNNWDIDGDGKPESISFIGNGGAHLYFYLQIRLSKDNIVRDFPFLVLDFPLLGSIEQLKNVAGDTPPFLPQFVVHDVDGDGDKEIYLNFDITFSSIPEEWKKKGLTSRYVLLDYKNRDIVMRDYRKY